MNWRLIALAVTLALAPVVASAQTLVGGGAVTPGHAARWVAPGVLGDGGGAAGSQKQGSNYLSEVGITNTGTPFGINDALQSALGGYHSLTFGANALGGGMINYQANAGAQPLPLQICANGQCVQFPFNLTGVQGPNTSVAGDFACWNNTNGTLIKDCGISPTTVGCPSIVAFGGAGDNSTDNASALTAAIAAQGSRACVFFPPGQFKFASTVQITLGSPYGAITIAGSGPGVSELIGAAGQGVIALTETSQFNTFNFQDVSVEASSACAGCKGISVVQTATITAAGNTPTSSFSRVHFYGTDRNVTTGNNYWGTAIYIESTSNVNFEGVYIQGIFNNTAPPAQFGIDVEALNSNVPVVFNMHSTAINDVNTGLSLTSLTQGATISQSNFTGDLIGINVPPGPGSGGQLTVTTSQFNCNIAVNVNSVWGTLQVSDNLFIMGEVGATSWVGLQFGTNASFVTITGNAFEGSGGPATTNTVGISTAAEPHSGVITGNVFSSLETGVQLDTGAKRWVVNPNWYFENGTNLFTASPFGNVINNSVSGLVPTLASDCGTGAGFQGSSTDQGGLIAVGTAPAAHCTITFSGPFQGLPNCTANNNTSPLRAVTPLFPTSTTIQITTTAASLNANDVLGYHCDGYQ